MSYPSVETMTYGIGFMCPAERPLDVVFPESVIPNGLAVGSILVEGFIDNIPGVNLPTIMASDSLNMALRKLKSSQIGMLHAG